MPRSPQSTAGVTVLRLVLLALAVAGCVLLAVAEFSTLYEIRVITVAVQSEDAGSHHGYALLVIAVAALVMSVGALLGGSRPAAWALLGLAAAAVFVTLAIDLPDVGEEGLYGERYEQARSQPKTGFYLETLGAALLLFAAVATLVLRPGARRRERPAEGDDAAGGRRRRHERADEPEAESTAASAEAARRHSPESAAKRARRQRAERDVSRSSGRDRDSRDRRRPGGDRGDDQP